MRLKHSVVLGLLCLLAASGAAGAATTWTVPGDFATIQAAVTAAGSGDTIQVAAGTYNERVTINKPLTLLGAQSGVDPTLTGARTNPAAESIIDITGLPLVNPNVLVKIVSGGNNVVVDGFTLVGSPSSHYADEATVWVDVLSDVGLKNNIVTGFYGVLFKGGSGLTAEANRMSVNKLGVTVQPSAASNVTVAGNRVEPGGSPEADAAGVYMTAATDSAVTGNTATGFSGSNGVGGSNLTRLSVSGNTFTGNKTGVNIWGTSTFIDVLNNEITGCSEVGVKIKGQDITIANNTLTGNAEGVRIDFHVLTTERVSVAQNDLSGNSTAGLQVTAAVTATVDAEENWWGDASGPTCDANPCGIGTVLISGTPGNADFEPWLGDGTDTSSDIGFQPNLTPLYDVQPPTQVWVDDDYCDGCANDGHTWGCDAFSVIQDGIDEVAAGGTVHVAAGSYVENVTISKSLDLLGADRTTTTIDGNNVGNAITITASDVTVSGFTVTGGHYTGNVFYACGGIVIEGNGGTSALTGITIEDNTVDSNAGSGIYVSAAGDGGPADNILIKDCEISNNGSDNAGISLTYPDYIVRPVGEWDEWRRPKNVRVEGNTLVANDDYGVYVSAGENIVIVSNTMRDSTKYGLQLTPTWNRTDCPSEYVTVEDNDIYDNTRNGVKLTSWNQYNTFLNNRIYGNGFGGTSDYYKYGFLFQDGNNNTIQGNQIAGNALGGLYLWGKGDPTYDWYSTTDNTIVENVFSGHTAAGGHGIYVPVNYGNLNSGFLNSHINRNGIFNNEAYGIENADTTQTIDALENWWGDPSGPYDPKTLPNTPNYNNPTGTGDAVSAYVEYGPWVGQGGTAPPTEFWVNDDWAGLPDGTVVTASSYHVIGYDAFGTIQEGIDAAAPGDTVHVLDGTYTATSLASVVIAKDGLQLIGESRDGTIIDAGAWGTSAAGWPKGIQSKANNVVIENFTVQGFTGDMISTGGYGVLFRDYDHDDAGEGYIFYAGCRLENVLVQDCYSAVYALVHPGLTVTGCLVQNNYSDGMFIARECDYATITGNTVINSGDQGIWVGTDWSWVGPSDNATITGNVVDGAREGGINFTRSNTALIKNNDVTNVKQDPGGWAIGAISIKDGCSDVTIQGNVIHDNAVPTFSCRGIGVDDTASDITITGNTISGNSGGGIGLLSSPYPASAGTKSNVTIQNNHIVNNTGDGVEVNCDFDPATVHINYNAIHGNSVLGVSNDQAKLLDALNNWWGHPSGPYDNKTLPNTPDYNNPSGTGNGVTAYVDYMPWAGQGGAVPPTEVWVDDDWAGLPDGTVVTASSYHVIGYDAFDTIQEGVDAIAAGAGNTVHVLDGLYEEDVNIAKALTLSGSGEGSCTIMAPTTTPLHTWGGQSTRPVVLVESASDVTISGFTVDGVYRDVGSTFVGVHWWASSGSIEHCTITRFQPGAGTPTGGGSGVLVNHTWDVNVPHTVSISYVTVSEYGKNGITVNELGAVGHISYCIATGAGPVGLGYNGQNGIQIGYGATGSIDQCTVSDHQYTGPDWDASGIVTAGVSGVTVTNNDVSDNDLGIALASDPYYGYGDSTNCSVYGNSVDTCTWLALDESAAPSTNTWDNGVDTGNTWGDFASNRGWPYFYTISDGTDPIAKDRWPTGHSTLSEVWVSPTGDDEWNGGTATWPFATIQKGVDMVVGSTVHVTPGTYSDPVDIENKADMTIVGDDRDTCIVKSSTTLPWGPPYGSSRTVVFRVYNSTNVKLQNLTMDFDLVKANLVHGILYWNATGEISGNLIKNMSVDDASGGYTEITSYLRAPDPPYTDGSRAQIAIKNNTFQDTGRLGVCTHNWVHTTIEDNTFLKTTDDFGYAMEIGSSSTATIRRNVIHGYDTEAASDGSESAGIYVENSFTAPGYGSWACTKPVVVEDNHIYDCQYGMWIGNEYDGLSGDVDLDLTLTNNNIHNNLEAGLYVVDEDASAGSSVTVTGRQNRVQNNGGAGYYIYSYGDGDLTVDLAGETITGHADGILVDEDAPGSTYDVTVTGSSLADNTAYGVENATTSLVDARGNWWGDATGPYDNKTLPGTPNYNNPGGLGSPVTAYVLYDPWLSGDPTQWGLVLTVTGSSTDNAWMGVRGGATDGQDTYDSPKPSVPQGPPPYAGLWMWWDRATWTPTMWARDFRAPKLPSQTKIWPNLIVKNYDTAAPHTATLTWADLGAGWIPPDNYTFQLWDHGGSWIQQMDPGGSYVFSLAASATRAFDIKVTTEPTCSISYAPASPVPCEDDITFTATASDADGTIASYQWDFGDGFYASGNPATHAYSAVGVYTVTLTVVDDAGARTICTTSVTIGDWKETTLYKDCWYLISFPCQPGDPDPENVIGPAYTGAALNYYLWKYDHDTGSYVLFDPAGPGGDWDIERGQGYWLLIPGTGTQDLGYWACCYAGDAFDILCTGTPPAQKHGWYLVGQPHNATTNLTACQLNGMPFLDGVYWLASDPLWAYDCSLGGYVSVGIEPWDSLHVLSAWTGYWFYTFEDDVTLTVP